MPNPERKQESYLYNSQDTRRITKGSLTIPQLYYFRGLLTNSYDEATNRIRKLTKDEIEKICTK